MGSGVSMPKVGTSWDAIFARYGKDIKEMQKKVESHPFAEDVHSLEEAKKQLAYTRNLILSMLVELMAASKNIAASIKNSTFEQELETFLSEGGKVAASFWLQHSEACKECLGPISMEKRLISLSHSQAVHGYQTNAELGNWDMASKQMLNIEKVKAQKQKLESKMSRALHNLSKTRVDVASEVSHRLVADITHYSQAISMGVLEEPEAYAKLNETAAAIVNVSDLKVGAKVQVVNAGSFTKACVVEVKSGGTYKVSLWKELGYHGTLQEEGYETSEAEYLEVPRVKLYALHVEKVRQTLSDATMSLICGNSKNKQKIKVFLRDTKRPEFLMALYVDARGARIYLEMLAQDAATEIDQQSGTKLKSVIPALKAKERATVKTQEKYGGDYSCLTDLARMTFECASIAVALAVLTFIHEHPEWTIIRIKNRLDQAYDASPTGGYRDMLINAIHRDHRHYVEIQVTLASLLKIKKNGGHAVYKLARLLELNEKATTLFDGQPTEQTVSDIAAGLVRDIHIHSVPLKPKLRDALFSDQGLISSSSAVMSLDLDRIASLNGWSTARALSHSLMQRIGVNLKALSFCECGLEGPFPDTIGLCCPNLERIDFCRNKSITGDIPKSFWSLSKMRIIYLEDLALTGSIPEDISQMRYLQEIYMGKNKLTGPIPKAIGTLKNLVKCSLYENRISGPIPSTIGGCTKLKQLLLYKNPLEGRLPTSVLACTQLQSLLVCETLMDLEGYPVTPGNPPGLWEDREMSQLFSCLRR